MTYEMRYCEADGCGAVVTLRMVFCRRHWGRLPVALRRRLRNTDQASPAFDMAVDEARDLLAAVEEG